MIALLKKSTDYNLATMFGERPCFRDYRRETSTIFLQNNCLELKYPGRKIVILLGNSHSASLSLGLRPLLDQSGVNFLQVSAAWCEPTSNNDDDRTCRDINDLVLNRISDLKPDLVILDSHWLVASQPPYFIGGGDYFAHVVEKLNDLERRGAKRLIVVGQMPTWNPSLPQSIALNFVLNNEPIPQRTFLSVAPDSLQMDATMRAINYPPNVTYLSMKDALCDDAGCLTTIGPNLDQDLVLWDYSHLTQKGSEFVTHSLIEPALSDINILERKR